MNRSDSPKKQPKPFGVNGQREDILPTTPAGDNTASYDLGFPPITMILKSAGGLPPKGQDMNQILYELSSLCRWFSAGALNTFDSKFSEEISGYPLGAVLLSDSGKAIYVNTIDSNKTNPNSSGSIGWIDLFAFLKSRESFSGIVGTSRNGRMSITNMSVSATYTADELIVESDTGQQYRLRAFNKTVNISTSGAGGMDEGSAPSEGFIALYAIFNPMTGETSLLAANATTTALPEIYDGDHMPAGYTASALISVWRVESGQFTPGYQLGRNIYIPMKTVYSTTAPSTELSPVSFSKFVPMNAVSVSGYGQCNGVLSPTNCIWLMAGDKAETGRVGVGTSNTGNLIPFKDVPLITPQTVYLCAYTAGGDFASAYFGVNGYVF